MMAESSRASSVSAAAMVTRWYGFWRRGMRQESLFGAVTLATSTLVSTLGVADSGAVLTDARLLRVLLFNSALQRAAHQVHEWVHCGCVRSGLCVVER